MRASIWISWVFLVATTLSANAQNKDLIRFAQDAVDVCIFDLKGGDSKTLLAKKGYNQDGQTLRKLFFKKYQVPLRTSTGKVFSASPALSITKNAKRKRLSKCGVILSGFAYTTSNFVYQEMQKHARALGYISKPSRNAAVFEKDGFAFGIRGQQSQTHSSLVVVRYSN